MSVFKKVVPWFVITIVAMFTIVATTHNCCKKPQLSQHQPQLSHSWSTTSVVTPITNVAIFSKNIGFSIYILIRHFIQFSLCFAQLNYENCEIPWHTIRLSYNCHNFDIETVTIVKYLKSLLCHMKKIATCATTRV